MANPISVTTKRNDFVKLAQAARTMGGTNSRQTAEAILADAQRRVHVITGATRASGRVEPAGIGYDVIFDEGAIFEEYGTRYRPPHPFLTPAAEAQRAPFLDALKKALE